MRKVFFYILHPKFFLLRLMDHNIIKVSDKFYLDYSYKLKMGKKLDLNHPETFNEKLQWLKLYNRKDVYTTMVDKYEVKKYVSDIIGSNYIIPTIGVYDKFDEIDFNKLPKQFVMKCTHDSGGIVIVKDKSKMNLEQARKKIESCLKVNYFYNGREWPYKNVKPRIIIEEYVEDNHSTGICDYKLYCFNGEVKFILVCTDRDTNLKETFFDTQWNLAPFRRLDHEIDMNIKKPIHLNQMISLAKELSKKEPFIRVDFYEINDKVYFGELTLFPSGGLKKFTPDEWDKKLGDYIDLELVKERV